MKLQIFVNCTLAPGGTLADDMMRTDVCVFAAQEDLETMQAFAQVMKDFFPLSCCHLKVLKEHSAFKRLQVESRRN